MGSEAQLGHQRDSLPVNAESVNPEPVNVDDDLDDLERALRAYETALVGPPPGRRTGTAEPSELDLQRLRREVIRRSGSVPTSEWPRPPCRHCRGERVLHLSRASANAERELVSTPCPPCWGTGLTLDLAYRRRLERTRASEP